jgi:phosphate transport system protein
MTSYEQRLQEDLDRIGQQIESVSEKIRRNLHNAIYSLLTGDRDLANKAILGDLRVNRRIRDIDHQCLVFVVRHLPTAGHLRYVTATRRLTVELERIGDYGVSIGRATVQLSAPPPTSVLKDIEMMADHAERMLEASMRAFLDGNADEARGVRSLAGQMDSTYRRAIDDLIREGERSSRPFSDLLATFVVMNRLERVNDQSKNICEETVFAVTGEAKPPKVYDVLFLDERNSCLSKLAEAIARRDYPCSGRYSSAGWSPAAEMDASCLRFIESRGLEVKSTEPQPLQPIHDALADFEIIISLQGDARPFIPTLPFQTVLLEWDVGPPIDEATPEEVDAMLERAHDALTARLQDLIHTIRGREAD